MGSALQLNNVLATLLTYLLPTSVSDSVHKGTVPAPPLDLVISELDFISLRIGCVFCLHVNFTVGSLLIHFSAVYEQFQ